MLIVAELCDLILRKGCATKKASTIATDRGRIDLHVKPLLEKRKASDLSRSDIQRLAKSLEAAERNGVNIHAPNIIRLLILTGARKSEIHWLS